MGAHTGDPSPLLQNVARRLRDTRRTVSTAESCTGGLLAKVLTDVPGSSAYFLAGVVAYANEAKEQLLGVSRSLIARHGAVSSEVAEAMAAGLRRRSAADCAISITGIAGPSGGTADKPVGLVFIGLADDRGCEVRQWRLGSDCSRASIREAAVVKALEFLVERISAQPEFES